MSRLLLSVVLLAYLAAPAQAQPEPRTPADRIDGPPLVSAKAWAIADGKTGKLLWGVREKESAAIASVTKIMTAWIVLQLAHDNARVLDEVVTFSERAAKTPGSSSHLRAGDRVAVRDLLYGLLLPSGNDAAVALGEHFGGRLGEAKPGEETLVRFVAEMNRRAQALELAETKYLDPHGLGRNLSSARDLAVLTWNALKNPLFGKYVETRRHSCEVSDAEGKKRTVTWENGNRLLGIEGYEGVKTGTTSA